MTVAFIEVTIGKRKDMINLADVAHISPSSEVIGATQIIFSLSEDGNYWFTVDESYDQVKEMVRKAGALHV